MRKTIAYVLVLTLPLSAWAGAGAPCAQNTAAESRAEIATVGAHAQHAAAPSAANGSADASAGHAAHHAAVGNDTESTPAECPCCDGCDTACVLSSCSPVALFTIFGLTALTGTDRHCSRAVAFRDGPAPHVLFRPPIVSV